MIKRLKCMFLEDFKDGASPERFKLEHQRLQTVFSVTGNLMVAMLVFGLFYISIFNVSVVVATGMFFLWTCIFVAV